MPIGKLQQQLNDSNLHEFSVPFIPFRLLKIRCGIPQNLDGEPVNLQPLSDVTNTAILKNSISVRLSKAMVFPYIFNDYTFNVHNYSTNAANSFLTLFHSILHYSSLDIFDHLLEFLRRLRKEHSLKTDVQLLYICAMLGPILHRTEKLNNTDAIHTDADVSCCWQYYFVYEFPKLLMLY